MQLFFETQPVKIESLLKAIHWARLKNYPEKIEDFSEKQIKRLEEIAIEFDKRSKK